MKTLMMMMMMMVIVVSLDVCSSMPRAVNDITPVSCCVQFYAGNIPPSKITFINKTHSTCPSKAFVVTTVAGKKICVRDTWVHRVLNQPAKA